VHKPLAVMLEASRARAPKVPAPDRQGEVSY